MLPKFNSNNKLIQINLYLLICVCFTSTVALYLPEKQNLKTIVIEVNGDCSTIGATVAHLHGYRVVREIFPSFCEVEIYPLLEPHEKYKRALSETTDHAAVFQKHEHISWAVDQVPKRREKREYAGNDPKWSNMWYLNRLQHSPSSPDLNVSGAWALGYTGRGAVVTFLDDGLEYTHQDLRANYDSNASYDINSDDYDPIPRYDPTNENRHGTRCAGEVAAVADNNICIVGVAYNSKVGGIRMLDGDVTDSVEARSLSYRSDHIDIYSASWGPNDDGLVVEGPGRLTQIAFEDGAHKGRDGKGSIFVWASGNGGSYHDSCGCDGYINSIYTIAISATTQRGEKPWYLEECSAVFASTYSSGAMNGEEQIISTDIRQGCTSSHSGTSAAAPLAAGLIALMLEANPNLTWRDVMHIIVLSARPSAIPSNTDYVTNAIGFNVSNRYGFGLMDAGLMTWYAEKWINVPQMVSCTSAQINSNITSGSHTNDFEYTFLNCHDGNITQQINYIEQVRVFVNLSANIRGDVELYLYSPSGTKTQLLPSRKRDRSDKGFQDWPFLTVQLWGESPHGSWKIQVVNLGFGQVLLQSYRLVIHGTKDYPWSSSSTAFSSTSPK